MIRLPLSLLSVLALAACGGGGPVDTGPPPDVKLDQANKAGTQALSMDLPSLAVRQYKVALSRAYERDDAGAIGDVAYNLALAQMKAGDSKGAIATAREARGRAQSAARAGAAGADPGAGSGLLSHRRPRRGSRRRPGSARQRRQGPGRRAARLVHPRSGCGRSQRRRGPRPGDRRPSADQAGGSRRRPPGAAGPGRLAGQRLRRGAQPVRAIRQQPPTGARLPRHGAGLVAGGRCGLAIRPRRRCRRSLPARRAKRPAAGRHGDGHSVAEACRGPRQADRPDRHRRGGDAAAQSGGRADEASQRRDAASRGPRRPDAPPRR